MIGVRHPASERRSYYDENANEFKLEKTPDGWIGTWNGFSVEADAERVWERLLRLETDFELGVAFRLDVVGHVPAIDGNDYLQIASARLAGVDCGDKLNL